ncbi:unnamed protein product [Bubo scandiacus]
MKRPSQVKRTVMVKTGFEEHSLSSGLKLQFCLPSDSTCDSTISVKSVTFIDTQKKCDCFYVNCAMLHVKGLISVKGTFANKFNGSRTCSLYNTGQCFYPKDKTSNITAGKGRTSDL